jgi:hypothetical protein
MWWCIAPYTRRTASPTCASRAACAWSSISMHELDSVFNDLLTRCQACLESWRSFTVTALTCGKLYMRRCQAVNLPVCLGLLLNWPPPTPPSPPDYRHVAWQHVSVHDETKEKDFKDKYEHALLFVIVISQRSFRCCCCCRCISFLFNTKGRCDSLRGKWILGRMTFYLYKCTSYNALYARVLNYVT